MPPYDDEGAPPIENESTTQPGGDPAPSLRERWVTRWRAAGAELTARSQATRGGTEPMRPAHQPRLDPVPLKQPVVPRVHPVVPPSLDPALRPITVLAPSRVETRPVRPKAEPSRTFNLAPDDPPWTRQKTEQARAVTRAAPAADRAPSWAEWLSKDQPVAPLRARPERIDLADPPAPPSSGAASAGARAHPDAAADDRTVAERSRPVPPSPSSDSSLVMTPAIDAYVAELSQAEPRRSEVDSGVPEPGGWETLLSPVDPQRSDVDSGVPESGGSETLLSQTDRPAPRCRRGIVCALWRCAAWS